MFENLTEKARPRMLARTMEAHVDLKVPTEVRKETQRLMAAGGVPLAYYNHEGHPDGIATVVHAEYLRKMAKRSDVEQPLRGLAVPIAKSMATGDQSQELTGVYEELVEAGRRKGLEPVPTRRLADKKFNMDPKLAWVDLLPFIRLFNQDYGLGLFPEGTVQGGRHPEGTDIEQIYGIQVIENNSLIGFFGAMRHVLSSKGKFPFYLPTGLHGSFRLMDCPEGGQPVPTEEGRKSLTLGALTGFALHRIRANMLMPFTEEEVIADLGLNWMEGTETFNNYAMKRVLPGIPPQAWGVFRENHQNDAVAQAIEFQTSS